MRVWGIEEEQGLNALQYASIIEGLVRIIIHQNKTMKNEMKCFNERKKKRKMKQNERMPHTQKCMCNALGELNHHSCPLVHSLLTYYHHLNESERKVL